MPTARYTYARSSQPTNAQRQWAVFAPQGGWVVDQFLSESGARCAADWLNLGVCRVDIHRPLGTRVQPIDGRTQYAELLRCRL